MRATASLVLPRERYTVPAVRAMVARTLRSVGVGEPVLSDLSVAVSEACTNAICHAGGDEYRVDVVVDPDECTIIVEDRGPGFEPPAAFTMPAPEMVRGRGLVLMDRLVDDLEVRRAPGGGAIVILHRDVADVTPHGVSA